jgi:hypothetical protein
MSADAFAVWDRLLAEFERELEAPSGSAWQPPEGAPPLPVELAIRAREIADRQLAAMARLERELVVTSERMSAAEQRPADRTAVSVYLDVAG